MVEPFLEGKTMEDAMNKKKLYLMDLTYMSDIECSAGRKVSYQVNTVQKCIFRCYEIHPHILFGNLYFLILVL